jgi:spore coat polysaccharide biosynthesis predicted glycosyltransferase SpsG
MIVGILTAANGKIGGGHLIRMQEIKKIFIAKGILCEVFTNLDDLVNYLLFSNEKKPVVIIDLPQNHKIDLDKMKSLGHCLKIGYELSNNLRPDYNIVPYKFKNRNFLAKYDIYSGAQYLIIRSEIRALRSQKEMSDSSSLLISLGSGRTFRKAILVYKSIKESAKNKYVISIILGPHSKRRFISSKNIVYAPRNFPELLNSSSIVFTNGGTTLIESLYLGKYVYCFPQNDDEKEFSFFLSKHHDFKIISLPIGKIHLDQIKKINKTKQVSFIDGLGSERVVDLISTIYTENEVL